MAPDRTIADIDVTISGRSDADLPTITGGVNGNNGIEDLAAGMDGLAASNMITMTLAPGAPNIPYGTKITLMYLGYEDLVMVEGDGDSMPLRLLETSSSSGIFKATVVVVNGDDAAVMDSKGMGGNANLKPSTVTAATGRPTLAVSDGSSVIVRYRDQSPVRTATARVDVEDDVPNFSNVMPADNAETNNLDTVLSAEVSDNIAGVNPSKTGSSKSVQVFIDDSEVTAADIAVVETAAGSGVYVISYNINKIDDIADAKENDDAIEKEISWEIRVKDKAGNVGTTNSTIDPPGRMTLTVKTTRPTLDNAYSGDNWDASVDDQH